MPLSNIILAWVPEGIVPTSGTPFDQPYATRLNFDVSKPFETIKAAAVAALRERDDRKAKQQLPYLKAHTGQGVAIFNDQGILAIGIAMGVPL